MFLSLFFASFLFLNDVNAQLLSEKDKQAHFAAGTVFGGVAYGFILKETGSKTKALLGAITTAFIVGTLKESRDSGQDGNRFDKRDLLATTYGGIAVGVTMDIYRRKGDNGKRVFQFKFNDR